MAKGKSSRKERRAQRQKSTRAREHGLPSRPPERPQPRARGTRDSEGRRLRPVDEAALPSEAPPSEGAAEPSRLRRYLARVLDLPTAGKLAILAILGVIVLAIVSGLRDRGGNGREVAPPPATLSTPSVPVGLPELPAASPGDASVLAVPSAEPSAQPPAASAMPPVRALKPPTKAPPPSAPKRGDNPY